MAVHGDIQKVSVNHPTLGSRMFFPKAGESGTLDVGGIRNADDSGMITASGSMMYQKNRVMGSFEILCENDTDVRQDVEFIASLQADSKESTWTIDLANGTVYTGVGQPVGDIQYDTNAGTFTLKVAAPSFEKIA